MTMTVPWTCWVHWFVHRTIGLWGPWNVGPTGTAMNDLTHLQIVRGVSPHSDSLEIALCQIGRECLNPESLSHDWMTGSPTTSFNVWIPQLCAFHLHTLFQSPLFMGKHILSRTLIENHVSHYTTSYNILYHHKMVGPVPSLMVLWLAVFFWQDFYISFQRYFPKNPQWFIVLKLKVAGCDDEIKISWMPLHHEGPRWGFP